LSDEVQTAPNLTIFIIIMIALQTTFDVITHQHTCEIYIFYIIE
jgi:hypothetical protein